MTDDQELLELAAKAAGIVLLWARNDPIPMHSETEKKWNPLADDGDALRLAVKLQMNLDISWRGGRRVSAMINLEAQAQESIDGDADAYAATRRAIVRAAAEIGKAL